jgi:UPF0755 protein
MKRRRLFWIASVALLACGATSALAFTAARTLDLWQVVIDQVDKPATTDDRVIPFSVQEGDSAASIGQHLEQLGLIGNALAFRWLAAYYGVDHGLKSGEYELSGTMKPSDILAKLHRGLIKTTDVTLLEGWRIEQIADELDKKNIFPREDFLREAARFSGDFGFLREKPAGSSLEGYLFPDTYRLPAGIEASDLIQLLLNNFDQRFTSEMRQQAAARGLSVHDAVTLASIVEREAVVPEERPIIAAVFLNRLQKGMLLQADPTVQYALGSDPALVVKDGYWKKDLTRQDLASPSNYNTYLHQGLPPGPICNPGLASLKAVVEAGPTDYLYFVAKNDGSHAFAKTLEEHNDNVRRYRQ